MTTIGTTSDNGWLRGTTGDSEWQMATNDTTKQKDNLIPGGFCLSWYCEIRGEKVHAKCY